MTCMAFCDHDRNAYDAANTAGVNTALGSQLQEAGLPSNLSDATTSILSGPSFKFITSNDLVMNARTLNLAPL